MLLAQHNKVVVVDIISEKIDFLNMGKSSIEDTEILEFLINRELKYKATLDKEVACAGADYVIIITPNDYDPETNYFNTTSVESVIKYVMAINPSVCMVIKSTVPVGYTARIREKLGCEGLILSPNFCVKAKHFTIIFILHVLLWVKI
jgi:UDPglucose 6-dehydrogenase